MPDCVMVSHSLWILRSVFLFVPMCFICFHIFLFMFHYGKFPVDVSSHSLILFLTVSNLIMSLTKKFFISSTFIFKNFSHCHLPLMISLSLLKFSTNINIFSTLSLDPSHINHSHFKVQHLEPFWFWYCQIVFFSYNGLFSLCLCSFLIECQTSHAESETCVNAVYSWQLTRILSGQ